MPIQVCFVDDNAKWEPTRMINFPMSTLRTTKLPMNLRHCTQPLNAHQLTSADAQHEAATDITRGIGIVAVVERRSESRVRAGLWQRRTYECEQLSKNIKGMPTARTDRKQKQTSKHSHGIPHHDANVPRACGCRRVEVNGKHLQMARVLSTRCPLHAQTSNKQKVSRNVSGRQPLFVWWTPEQSENRQDVVIIARIPFRALTF